MLQKHITYFGRPAVLSCDGRCEKAWGINNRPKVALDPKNPDDYAFLSDDELGIAPADPGTYEGGYGKPPVSGDSGKMNKWCCRECERSQLTEVGEDVKLPDYSKRRNNILSKNG